jgi:hypothetical protein
MARKLQLARILAAVVVIAAFAVPSPASAHEGHLHHAPGAVQAAPASSPALAHDKAHDKAAVAEAIASVATLGAARTPDLGASGVPRDCAGHCCGGSAGMACCGAALAPDPICVPIFRTSVPFVVPHDLPSSGLPPEALPRPPKSFA